MATNLLFCWGQPTTEAYDGLPPGRGVRFDTDDIELLRQPARRRVARAAPPARRLDEQLHRPATTARPARFTVMADYPELKHIIAFEYDGRPVHQRARHRREPQGRRDRQGGARRSCSRPASTRSASTSRSAASTSRSSASRRRCAAASRATATRNTLFVPFTTLKTAFNMGDRVGFFALTAKPGTDGPELERAGPRGARRATTASRRPTSSRSARSTCS